MEHTGIEQPGASKASVAPAGGVLPEVKPISSADRAAFDSALDLTRRLYADDRFWVQPLAREMRYRLDPARNPFLKYGKLQLFAAFSASGEIDGSIAAILNPIHERIHGEKAGFFGLFECADSQAAAAALVAGAEDFLREHGCTTLIGPVNLTTNDDTGLLIEGYGTPPSFMCNYCRPYYHALLEGCGFRKRIDLLAYETRPRLPFPAKYERVLERISANPRLRLQAFNRRRAAEHALLIRDVYNASFASLDEFVPMSQEEALSLSKGLLTFADPKLAWIAFYDERPAGCILGFPDLNEVLIHMNGRVGPLGMLRLLAARWSIRGMRVAALGVIPEYRSLGIETALISRIRDRVNSRPYHRAEFSTVLETNFRMRRVLESLGFQQTKRYRLYGKEIA